MLDTKYNDVVKSPYSVEDYFTQWRVTNYYPFNDSFPFEFPKCGMNTIGVFTSVGLENLSVMCNTGNIIYFPTSERPVTISVSFPSSNTNYVSLRANGYSAGELTGNLVTASSIASDTGKIFHIGVINSYDFFFIPSGMALTMSAIPSGLKNLGGTNTYVWAKAIGYGDNSRVGMAINSWDGSYLHGTLSSPWSNYNGEGLKALVSLYCSGVCTVFTKNGVVAMSNRWCGGGDGTGDIREGLFSVVVPVLNNSTASPFPGNLLAQFNGYRITPNNRSGVVSGSLEINLI